MGMDYRSNIGPLPQNPEVHVQLARWSAGSPNRPARHVYLYHVLRRQFGLDQPPGGHQNPVDPMTYRYVAVGTRYEPCSSQEAAAIGHAAGRL
jgi:hypothetical protein